jgi:hypothetical protein
MQTLKEEITKIIEWALGGDTGSSSKSICRHMMGMEPLSFDWIGPSDSDDRGRCIRLLNLVPEWWSRLDEMAKVSEYWEKQIPLIRKEAESK